MKVVTNLNSYFEEITRNIPNCSSNTEAYILNVFSSTQKLPNLSKDSLTLIYSKAKFEYKFELFQNLGDWILFVSSFHPKNIADPSPDYFYVLAQNSYYKCYKLLNRQWKLFEELADCFPNIVTYLCQEFERHDEKLEYPTLLYSTDI